MRVAIILRESVTSLFMMHLFYAKYWMHRTASPNADRRS